MFIFKGKVKYNMTGLVSYSLMYGSKQHYWVPVILTVYTRLRIVKGQQIPWMQLSWGLIDFIP